MDNAYKPILDRDPVSNDAKRIFSDGFDLLREFVDFGTKLLPPLYQDSPQDITAICLIFCCYRQVLMHGDALTILLESGQSESAQLQLRAQLELAHTIEWILASDSDEKANHLFVSNLRDRLHANSIGIPGSPEALRRPLDAAALSLTAEQSKDLQEQIVSLQTTLAKPVFAPINAKFEVIYQRRGFDPAWTKAYDNNTSVRSIALELNRGREYDCVYSPYSGTMHGSDMWNSVVFGSGSIEMNPVRSLVLMDQVLRLAKTLLFRVIKLLIVKYRPGEMDNLSRIYVEKWRARFLQTYDVTFHPEIQEI